MTQDYSLGIDIGGTFTDLVIHDHASGRRWGTKVLTTHADPQQGVIAGVRAVLGEAARDEPAVRPGAIGRVVHATTLFTNALIERKGAPTGLLVTQGFRDMLEIARERKYDLYDIGIDNPPPLVPRNLRREVSERMRADGAVAEALDEAQLLRQAEALRAAGCTSIALVFLHAYANPAHEIAAARAIAAQMPEMFVTPSHEVVREIREYERASTTVASAYIKPIAAHYLAAMERELAGLGITAPLLLMLSGGGLTHAAEVNRNPGADARIGAGGGGAGGGVFRRARRGCRFARLRHGRHHRQIEPGRRRRAAGRLRVRGGAAEALYRRQRAADPAVDGRADRDRRRRRQHHPARRDRPLEGRAGQRRLRAGPGMLRKRRHGADRHRRQSAARLPQPGFLCRRVADHRQGGRRDAPSPGWRQSWGCRRKRPRPASTRWSTRTWLGRRAFISPSAAATRAATRWSAPAAAGRCTATAWRGSWGFRG